jgi:NAD+ kinase
MSAPRRILLVSKVPLVERLSDGQRARLAASGAMPAARLTHSADRQRETLATVLRCLAGHQVRERRIHELRPDDAEGVELVVTAGGDGTVFTANTLATAAPFLTVNSDPEGSLGHFTRATAATVGALFAAWLAGRARVESLPRLRLRTPTVDCRFLNDALFTCVNPAAMSRYLLDDGTRCAKQRSSGVWIATAAGSTGGIHSAGLEPPVPGNTPALLWRVREPFHAFGAIDLCEGRQLPPGVLRLTPAVPGMALYLDGPNITVPLDPGDTATIEAAPEPLRLVVG